MKILVALDNEYIMQKLKELHAQEIYEYDISTKEEVIEFITKHPEKYTIITRDSLEGNLQDTLYAKQLHLANPNNKIIYVVGLLDEPYKEFLFANEVFNIIEEKTLTIENIEQSIMEEKLVIYKQEEMVSSCLQEAAIDYQVQVKNHIIPKQFIAIYGTSGSGKSTVASILSKNIVNDLNISVALLDMDIQNPSIDIINNITQRGESLSQIVEEVDKKKEISDILENYMIKDRKNKRLWYMTNNTSLFDCQNKLSDKYYSKIYHSIHHKYEYTIVDLPTSPFLDVVPYTIGMATVIYFVINPNYISIRQAIKYLDLLNKLWDIPKHKIHIIINKMREDSLDSVQVESLLYGYDVVTTIHYLERMEGYLSGAICELSMPMDIHRFYASLNIQELDGREPKVRKDPISFRERIKKVRSKYDH